MKWRRLFIPLALGAALMGCDPEPVHLDSSQPTQKHWEREITEIITPVHKTTRGIHKLVKREVKHVRIFTPFGISPGETITSMKGTKEVEQPLGPVDLSVGDEKMIEGRGGGSSSSWAGFKVTLWDRVKSLFRKLKWFAILGGGGLLLLLAFPITRPIASAILRILASIIPIVGSAIEWIIGRVRDAIASVRLKQVVKGGQDFKTRVLGSNLDAETKTNVIAMFKDAQGNAQDSPTVAAVASAKNA